MKLQTMKIRSKDTKKIGVNFITSNKNFYVELNLGKLTFLIGFFK